VYWSKPYPDPPEQLSEIQFCYCDLRIFSHGKQDTESAIKLKNWPLINRVIGWFGRR
jgi:hypothetical protein